MCVCIHVLYNVRSRYYQSKGLPAFLSCSRLQLCTYKEIHAGYDSAAIPNQTIPYRHGNNSCTRRVYLFVFVLLYFWQIATSGKIQTAGMYCNREQKTIFNAEFQLPKLLTVRKEIFRTFPRSQKNNWSNKGRAGSLVLLKQLSQVRCY